MEAVNLSLNAVEWWRLVAVGFCTGACVAFIGIWAFGVWAGRRAYMPGPFARPFTDGEGYRLTPPAPEKPTA